MVASRPSSVSVIRSAAPCLTSSSRTSESSTAKWAGMYMAPPSPRLCGESGRQAAPDGVVIRLAAAGPHGLLSGDDHPAALKQEGHRAGGLLRVQPGRAWP